MTRLLRLLRNAPCTCGCVMCRQWNINQLRQSITLYEDEIAEINRGSRHNAYHESQQG